MRTLDCLGDTSLEKPQLTSDVTTITGAHNLLRRDKSNTTILTLCVKETHSYCQQYVINAFSIDNNSNNHFLIPYYDVTGQMLERRVI